MSEPSAIQSENLQPNSPNKLSSKSGRKSNWRKFFIFTTIIVVLIYLLSLILINTSWAKNKLTSKLQAKTNSDWQVGSVLWIPFGEIDLHDLETSMGEGGIRVKSLKVSPSWTDFFSGSVNLLDVTASDADVDIDLKWLRENLNNDETAVFAQPKAIPNPQQNPQSAEQPPVKNKPITRNPGKQPQPTTKPEQKNESALINLPHKWLKVKNMDITLRNGEHVIEKITDLTVSIPYAGKPIKGKIYFMLLGHEYIQQVKWTGHELIIEETAGELLNMKCQWKLSCNPRQPRLPFTFQFSIPQQQLNHAFDKPNMHFSVLSDNVAAKFILRGALKKPSTWRGILNAGSENMMITENQKTRKRAYFDQTRLVAVMMNGTLNIPAAEAIGHKICLLANGSIHKNLYSYGVLRLITNDESRDYFEKVYHATKLINIDKSSYHFMSPLDTPDRRYCDIFFDGRLNDLEIRHDRSDSWQELNTALKKLLNFKNSELQEDGILEEE